MIITFPKKRAGIPSDEVRPDEQRYINLSIGCSCFNTSHLITQIFIQEFVYRFFHTTNYTYHKTISLLKTDIYLPQTISPNPNEPYLSHRLV